MRGLGRSSTRVMPSVTSGTYSPGPVIGGFPDANSFRSSFYAGGMGHPPALTLLHFLFGWGMAPCLACVLEGECLGPAASPSRLVFMDRPSGVRSAAERLRATIP